MRRPTEMREDMATPVLRISGLSKTFPGTRALDDVSLDIRRGEIHALMGQNGSGKSTLIKCLASYHQPDPGVVAEFDDNAFDLGHTVPEGLRFVHQDLGLVLELNALDNLALHGGFARGAGRRILWREQEPETYRILRRFGVDLDIHRPLAEATPVERTVVAIAAALQGWEGGGVLVLDEPTAVLPADEVARLFAVVEEVRRSGTAVLYVSHRMDEIFQLADRVTVLRGGRLVTTLPIEETDARGLAHLMVGEDVDPDYRAPVATRPDAPVVLDAREVHGRWLRGLDLDVHRGEILGIAGLAGAGALELPYVLAGGSRAKVSGRIRLPERSAEWHDVKDAGGQADKAAGGPELPLVPADRQREAVVSEFAVSENLSLSILDKISRRFRIDKKAERAHVQRWTERLGIVTAGGDSPISTLSGGNQQKVIVARCLGREAGVLLLCEPTAGVDIGTRVAIYELIAGLAADGLTVIVASSDEGDLLAMCTRIVVLRDGRVAGEMDPDGLTQQALVSAIEGDHTA